MNCLFSSSNIYIRLRYRLFLKVLLFPNNLWILSEFSSRAWIIISAVGTSTAFSRWNWRFSSFSSFQFIQDVRASLKIIQAFMYQIASFKKNNVQVHPRYAQISVVGTFFQSRHKNSLVNLFSLLFFDTYNVTLIIWTKKLWAQSRPNSMG